MLNAHTCADSDKVDLGNGLIVDSQLIAVANRSSGFDGAFDGIFGLGPTDLTQGRCMSYFDRRDRSHGQYHSNRHCVWLDGLYTYCPRQPVLTEDHWC
jgi:hypothetical protein